MGPLGFWTWSLFINIFTEEKYQKTIRDNYLPLSIGICLSFPARLTRVSIGPFVCLSNFQSNSQPVCLLICPYIYVLVAGEYAGKRKKQNKKTVNWLIIPTTVRTRPIISRIWPQRIAAVDDFDHLMPPGFQLFSHQSWLVQEQESVVLLRTWVRQTSGNQYTMYANSSDLGLPGFLFSTVSLLLTFCVQD